MSISFTYLSGRLTVYLSGELDHHAARETMQKITELLDDGTVNVSHGLKEQAV